MSDPTLGWVAEPAASGPTVVAFGGIRGGMGVPPYEFFRVTEGLGVRRIFVRDLDQVWYLRGIRGLGTTMETAAEALRAQIVESPGRVIVSGNSAGGFAAIAFGVLMDADEVHAFSPQTAIDRMHRLRWLDARWLPEMFHVRRLPGLDRTSLDLRSLLEDRPAGPQIHLHYCGRHGRDARHAEHLRGLPGVHLHRYEGGGHRLVTDLRDSGELATIVREAVRAPGSGAGRP